jgi:hypothetical protein
MSNNITDIQKALHNQLILTAGLPTGIERENERFKPNIRDPWVRTQLLPSETTQQSLGQGGYNNLNGTYQISLFFPAGRTDIDTINELVDAVVDNYVGANFLTVNTTTVQVVDAWRDISVTESDWFQMIVYVRWTSQQQRN